jgi:hypothetical protein
MLGFKLVESILKNYFFDLKKIKDIKFYPIFDSFFKNTTKFLQLSRILDSKLLKVF